MLYDYTMSNLELFLKNIWWNTFAWEFSSSSRWEWYDLDDIKEYEKQDNIRRINWKISAKYDKEYTNIYKLEKEPILDIFLDVDYNFRYFEQKLISYFSMLDFFIKKFWIRHNIYIYNNWKFQKIDNFNKLPSIKKWHLNNIIESNEFKCKNNYKLIVSDFLFTDIKDLDKLTPYSKKLFCIILPLYDILQKEKKLPLVNWFFNKLFMKDFMEDYKIKLSKVRQFFNEKI